MSASGLRGAPDNAAGVIVDFASGRARRVLDRHPAVLPQPGMKVMFHGPKSGPASRPCRV